MTFAVNNLTYLLDVAEAAAVYVDASTDAVEDATSFPKRLVLKRAAESLLDALDRVVAE